MAARHLAPADAAVLAVIGCGAQAFPHVEAVHAVRPLQRVRLHDVDSQRADALRTRVEGELGLRAEVCPSMESCVAQSPIVVTLTSSRKAYLRPDHVEGGAFIGAVGTDSPDKSEITPELMRAALVVTDDSAQCAEMGDLRHAIAAGAMGENDVWATLAEVAANPHRHRPSKDRTVVFDSTGIPIEDVVAARIAFEHAG